MEKYAAVLCKKFIKSDLSGKTINLELFKPIIGSIDENNILVTDDEYRFKCVDVSDESSTDELFYIFPFKIDDMIDFFAIDALILGVDDNRSEEQELEELLEMALNQYTADINANNYFLKHDSSKYRLTCYSFDPESFSTDIVDPRVNLYDALGFSKPVMMHLNDTPDQEVVEVEKPIEEIDVREEKELVDIDCPKLYKSMTETVISQDEAIKDIIMTMKTHYGSSNPQLKANILLSGKTGTGKTEILRQLASHIDVPIAIVDADQFSQVGFVGMNVDESLKILYEAADKNKDKMEHGILVFDEIDKKAPTNDNHHEISNKSVLDSLLKIMDGDKYYVSGVGEVDTSKITFIAAGAFSNLRNNIEKDEKTVGFNLANKPANLKKTEITSEDYIKFMTPEFIGRMSRIVQLNDLTEEDLVKILLTSKKSVLKAQCEYLYDRYKIKLNCSDKALEAIAKEAMELKTGARSLNNIVGRVLAKALEEIYFNGNRTYKELSITKKTVSNPKVYKLV